MRYHDNLLAPSSRLGPERLRHAVPAGELEKGDALATSSLHD